MGVAHGVGSLSPKFSSLFLQTGLQGTSEHSLFRGTPKLCRSGESEPCSQFESQPSHSAALRPELDAPSRDWNSHVSDTEMQGQRNIKVWRCMAMVGLICFLLLLLSLL